MENLKLVESYWDQYPCGIQVTDYEPGSKEFFEDIKKKFRETYPTLAHSDELLDFQGYKGKAVLEVGCGIGLDALEFARHGAQVTAIDLSSRNIALARKYFSHHNLPATIKVGNVEQLCFADATFDLVIAIGVLYYTVNTQKAVDEIFRVLKPGGKAICMFFNRYSWYVFLARISSTHIDHEEHDPPILKLYSVNEVKKLFEKFSVQKIIMDRFPTKSIKRSGILTHIYNYCFVPFCKTLPKPIIRPFGFHIITTVTK